MSVVSSVKSEDQDVFYGGTKKRPLSIIEEDDSDDGDAGPSSPANPPQEVSTKEIILERKVSSTESSQPVSKINSIKKADQKKRPQNIDTSRAKSQSSGSTPKSPNSKTLVSSDSKTSSKISHFHKSIRIAPETAPDSKVPPPVAPKPKTPSPSPSKVKSPPFTSKTADRHFAFHKSPTSSQSKKTATPKSKTTDTQTSEAEVVRSMKNIVKRTVSKIENHVASMASSSKQKVNGDPPRRKISKEEVTTSKSSSEEKENSNTTTVITSTGEAEKATSASASAPSSNKPQDLTIALTSASSTDADKDAGNADSKSSSDNSKSIKDIHTSNTPLLKETGIVVSNPDPTSVFNETENPISLQKSTLVSDETEIYAAENTTVALVSIPTSNATESSDGENLSATQKSTPISGEAESSAAENSSATQKSKPISGETESSAAESSSATQKSTPISGETENSAAESSSATQKSKPISGETESSAAENSSATQKPTPISDETESSASSVTPPTDDAERPTTPQAPTSECIGTENTIAIEIAAPNQEADKHSASPNSTPTINGAEKQPFLSSSHPLADEAERSSSNDTEVEDALRYEMANSRLSTSESSTPEFTTPPSSPPMPQSKQLSNVLFSPLLSSRSLHSSSEVTRAPGGSSCNSRSGHILSDGQGLARIREAAECLKLKSSSNLVPKPSPSPPSRRVPFSFRGSPKLAHRPFTEGYSLSLNNGKQMGSFNLNALSVPNQFSTKGDSGTSDSENEDKSHGKTGEKSRIAPRSPFLMPKFHPRRGSYFFKRRMSSESLASLSENESTDNAEETTPISASDFNQLKETADRLRLSTRRPSVLQWRQQYVESPGASGFSFKSGMNGDSLDEKLTSERKHKIDEALLWLRNELHEMRSQDQILARQLLTIRNDIHQLKLRRCTTEHQELLDDFKFEIEERQEFSDVLDIPQPIYEDNPLKHIGVTRLNISARRFSAC